MKNNTAVFRRSWKRVHQVGLPRMAAELAQLGLKGVVEEVRVSSYEDEDGAIAYCYPLRLS